MCEEAGSNNQCDQIRFISEKKESIPSHLDNQHQTIVQAEASTIKPQIIPTFYTCGLCENIFSSHEKLDEHLETEHGIFGSASCDLCDNIFLNNNEPENHIEVSQLQSSNCCDLPWLPCSMYDYTYQNTEDLNLHIGAAHGLTMHSK